jgi:hypothetical protein
MEAPFLMYQRYVIAGQASAFFSGLVDLSFPLTGSVLIWYQMVAYVCSIFRREGAVPRQWLTAI